MRLSALLLGAIWSPVVACVASGAATPGATGPAPISVASQPSLAPSPSPSDTAPAVDAAAFHAASIVIDTHDDVTQLLVAGEKGFASSMPEAQTDISRMREGGLDAEFLSVWVLPMLYPGDKAFTRSMAEFDAIDAMVNGSGGKAVLVRTAAEVRSAVTEGKTAFLIGVEGGHSLGAASDDELVERLNTFYERGARYMTLTWSNSNCLGGSSGDAGQGKGLTPFGERVVHVMNDLGMMIDISHVSDQTFADAVRLSRSPVLASHSSSRALSPHPRNMTDDMLRAVAVNGGAVCVNFGPEFLDADWNTRWKAAEESSGMAAIMKAHAGDPTEAMKAVWEKLRATAAALPKVPASKVIDHIEHIAKVAGVDHTCLGSDFDGIPSGPEGLEDVSKFPFITKELLARGFAPEDVRKILGENVLRVLEANQRGRVVNAKDVRR